MEWLSALTQRSARTVALSQGYRDFKAGGRVVITQGPLMGHEAQITQVSRRRGEATLSLKLLGRQVNVRVGLHLVRKSAR